MENNNKRDNRKGEKRMKLTYKRDSTSVLVLICLLLVILSTIDFCKFPEKYITSWKYQLKNDIESGNKQAIEYYERNYISKGKELF